MRLPGNNTERRCILRSLGIVCAAFVLLAPGLAASSESNAKAGPYDAYYGNYRIARDHMLGIDRFITDAGENTLLISDYQSGVVRRLFPVSETEFVMGPGFAVQSPAELDVRFVKDRQGNVTGISLQRTGTATSFAERVPLAEEEVEIANGDTRLAGTLMMPAAKGPHPAIILLHGSGPLTRYSFGLLSFSPLPALKDVTCPVLGVFGELDSSTDAPDATNNMRKVLSEAKHRDFTVKIFPNASHSLGEMPAKSRMAPGVFETLRSWLLDRVHVAEPATHGK